MSSPIWSDGILSTETVRRPSRPRRRLAGDRRRPWAAARRPRVRVRHVTRSRTVSTWSCSTRDDPTSWPSATRKVNAIAPPTATDIDALEQVLEDGQLVGDLGAPEHRHVRPCGIRLQPPEHLELTLEQRAGVARADGPRSRRSRRARGVPPRTRRRRTRRRTTPARPRSRHRWRSRPDRSGGSRGAGPGRVARASALARASSPTTSVATTHLTVPSRSASTVRPRAPSTYAGSGAHPSVVPGARRRSTRAPWSSSRSHGRDRRAHRVDRR
jgi:hypothetical protein